MNTTEIPSNEPVPPRPKDPNAFQSVSVDGQLKLVSEMTKEELQQALCNAIDLIERLEGDAMLVTRAVCDWRVGRLKIY